MWRSHITIIDKSPQEAAKIFNISIVLPVIMFDNYSIANLHTADRGCMFSDLKFGDSFISLLHGVAYLTL